MPLKSNVRKAAHKMPSGYNVGTKMEGRSPTSEYFSLRNYECVINVTKIGSPSYTRAKVSPSVGGTASME